jgi:hypothetical protein
VRAVRALVGNVITLPSLIIHREFPARSFGLVVGVATGFAQITFAWGPHFSDWRAT